MSFEQLPLSDWSLSHLQSVVAIDSASDENSQSVPTTPGQTELADFLVGFFSELGIGSVERDGFSNVIFSVPGRGAGADKPPVALMIHLDTARGTHAIQTLQVTRAWDGSALSFSKNPDIQVSTQVYPTLAAYQGHDIVHGPGDAPFGLDDKLGLTHAMTLFKVLAAQPELEHPPLIFVGRPDEEVGREEALHAVAELLSQRGVKLGYTLDGLDPFEVNVENFDAAGAWVRFVGNGSIPTGQGYTLRLGGVNTHGATAKAEGHRSALRFAAEIRALCLAREIQARFVGFESDAERDCDATCLLVVQNGHGDALWEAVREVVRPHMPRGASMELAMGGDSPPERGVDQALSWVHDFYGSSPGFVLAAEDSEGRQGYTAAYRLLPHEGGVRVDLRIRDFSEEGRKARVAHVKQHVGELPWEWRLQYDNMGPALADCPRLTQAALAASEKAGVKSVVQPIRGGTGVDPFLHKGLRIANLGTGYFAPESEKELTSLQFMAGHVRWLVALMAELSGDS